MKGIPLAHRGCGVRAAVRGVMTACALVIFYAAIFPSAAFCQDDEDELSPGLLAEYRSGERIIRRIDGDIALNSSGGGSPDVRLPDGPHRVRWSGQILLRAEAKYRWHAFVKGKLSVRLQDKLVLAGNSPEARWISGEDVAISFGEHPLEVEFENPGGGRILLCWSSDQFPLEPLPYHVLFHERTDVARGSMLAALTILLEQRCDHCHGDIGGVKSAPGPSLRHVGVETSRDWLVDHIQHGGDDQGRMPAFGFSLNDAKAVMAALQSESQPFDLPELPATEPTTDKEIAAGRTLVLSLGCLACHTWEQRGRAGDFGGPPLDHVAQRRTARWLNLWLSDPGKLNAHHCMPVFQLSDDERRQIIAALSSNKKQPAAGSADAPAAPSIIQHGQRLIREARCGACHELPGPKMELPASPAWAAMKLEADGCWSDGQKSTNHRPRYARIDSALLQEFLRALPKSPSKLSSDQAGAQLLVQKGCLNCHDRDGRQGVSAIAADLARSTPELEGHAPWLIPPPLTAVGDRLPGDRLGKAIRGELPKRRLDWLMVRMPRYTHADDEQSALVAHLIGHDRIPDQPPASPEYPASPGAETTLAGRELIGGKGFSCVACHPVKDFTPKNVALGTRGSNLFLIGERLRPEYFYRWTRAPLRVMPGVEMPSYQRPHPALLDGDLNRQLAAIWTALNDPKLPTPVNPGVMEQYWTVKSDDPPRVLRDVVTLPGKKKETVPRAFAVGFANGHGVLFDLDRAAVRAWTVGDFAQQRTQGKSWFWDLVGTPVMENLAGDPDLLILTADGKTTLFPAATAEVRHTHDAVDRRQSSVELDHLITVDQGSERVPIRFRETWTPHASGWTRRLDNVDDRGRDFQIWTLAPRLPEDVAGVRVRPDRNAEWQAAPASGRNGIRLTGVSSATAVIRYECNLQPASAPPVLPPQLLSAREKIKVVPGFRGERLPYPRSIMPTALTFDLDGRLLFTSLKGHVYLADDRAANVFAEGLAAPFGILNSLGMVLVSHKPEIIGLVDADRDGRADAATVIATGWGYTDNYHDWTCGLVRDATGNLFTTLGSDYSQKNRPPERSRWRGDVLKIDPSGNVESLGRGLRFPTGVAMTSQEHVFITDQQGLQNTFNELNWLQAGVRYGVPSLHEPDKEAAAVPPAVQIPHPWTRSVNGVCAIPKSLADRTHPKLFDQLLGCEYDNRFLIRMSWQLVDGVMQGAAYPFSQPSSPGDAAGFLGPLSVAVSPAGEIYVGSIHDSGWQGGLNTGDIVKLTPNGALRNGLCEIRATAAGFDLEFFHPVDRHLAMETARYQISGYTRDWQGSYATPDTGRHKVEVHAARLSDDGTTVSLTLSGLKPGHVYDVSMGEIGTGTDRALWPNIGHYTLHKLVQ